MRYLKKRGAQVLSWGAVFAAFHLYFFFFIQDRKLEFLLYLDVLLLAPALGWLVWDYRRFQGARKTMEELLGQQEIICRGVKDFENKDVAEHDVQVLEKQMGRQFQENCDLQDYVAKWCHELKIPLSAALLMDERIGDPDLRRDMREQLERVSRQLGSMLLGCRLQSPLLDLQIRKVFLSECVKASIHNNRFFLIQDRFQVQAETGDLAVYTDPQWLVYILDQLIGNALKYGKKEPASQAGEDSPVLKVWADRQERTVTLWVEDRGQGIQKQDMERIFEKGYTGSNYHNGKYKSTGMGLYMASQIARKLGHEIGVESEYGEYSRFFVTFGSRIK